MLATQILSLWTFMVIMVYSGSESSDDHDDCLVGDIMYRDGDSIGVIGKQCRYPDEDGSTMGDLAVHGTESFCVKGKIVEEDTYVDHCFNKGLYCCQAGESGTFGAAYCIKEENCVEYDSDKNNGKIEEIELYAIAEFTEDKTGAKGEVSVDENGNIVIDLDLTQVDDDVCDFKDDKVSYLYHIHNEWNYDEFEGKSGSDCNADTIGSHMDPFETGVTCGELENDEKIDYFSCELGDLSGRFGSAEPENDGKVLIEGNISHASKSGKSGGFCGLRLSPEVLYRKSVAFHCNDDAKTLLFCAPFKTVVYV